MHKTLVPGQLDVHLETTGRCAVVSARGELDSATAPQLERPLLEVLDTPQAASGVVVDLSGVTFCGSAGVRVLLMAGDRARELERPFAVACGAFVGRTLDLVGLRQVVGSHPTRDAAIAALV